MLIFCAFFEAFLEISDKVCYNMSIIIVNFNL